MTEIKFLEDENSVLLVVDGEIIEEEACEVRSGSPDYDLTIHDDNLAKKFSLVTFDAISKEIGVIEFNSESNFMGTTSRLLFMRESFKYPIYKMFLSHDLQLDEWKNSFSIKELDIALREIISAYNDIGIEYGGIEKRDNTGFDIEFVNINSKHTIQVEIESKKPLIDEIYNKVSNLLIEQSRENAVVSVFDFPEQVRVPCEQYLIYFADFLRNLGIKATADIAHVAGRVLFSVIPESKDIALQHIREALDMYLNLPGSMQDIQILSMDIGIKEQQLLAQIQHLKSQILLANALTQSQRDTIYHQQEVMNRQQQVIDASILQQSLLTETIKNKTEDSEKILGGVVSLTKYEGKGFQINVANIYRFLKEKFKKNERSI
ncbi:hypothetical protein [Paenibacillus alvei]|uniref:Uncharacterized protein n=1 Tax=Paenibacillus alvei TaxID=44250 RepID=A0AAP7A275_PAEAL|nr:hypothetical protein [Paenibacillus alvei]NOJ72031.1 hypothetical protein [Paenibacillus alvei]